MEKKLKVILFDLDGTLLPMDQDEFVKMYFGLLAKNLSEYGYEPKKLIESIWLGTKSMIMNDGQVTNEKMFWNTLSKIYGNKVLDDECKFEDFYIKDFPLVKNSCGFDKKANETIQILKEKGYCLVLATNPIFPKIATEQRIKWAGLNIEDFELVTTFENSSFAKPNLKYYNEILNKINCNPENCLMVGNDVAEDMVAKELGIDVFLLTRDLINKNNEDINIYYTGNYDDLIEYINRKSDF